MTPLSTRAATDRMFTKMQNQFGFLSPFSFPEMIKVRGCECLVVLLVMLMTIVRP